MKKTKNRQNRPVSALDVAAYILANHTNNEPILAWKMHKLVYYIQAWSLARDDFTFFYEKIMASPKGVVVNELCAQHFNDLYVGGSTIGNLNHLSLRQVDTIDYVMKEYGDKSLVQLDEMSRLELPWIEARQSVGVNSKGSIEVKLTTMREFYSNHGIAGA